MDWSFKLNYLRRPGRNSEFCAKGGDKFVTIQERQRGS